MRTRFTYKELTLLLGIAVALVVIFTLWIRKPAISFSNTTKTPGFSKIYLIKKVEVKDFFDAFEELRSDRNNPY